MSDLISRSALVNEIIEEANTKILALESGISLGEMKEWVESQPPVEAAPQWIPCNERIPEEYQENLCCDKYGNFIVGFPTTNAVSDTGYAVETDNEIMYDCIAWMPLPDPYKADMRQKV